MQAGPNARAVLHDQPGCPETVLWMLQRATHLTAPPVKAVEKSITTRRTNPNPRGANGVRRCFSVERASANHPRQWAMMSQQHRRLTGSEHQD